MFQYFPTKPPEFLIPAEQRKLKGHLRNTLWKPSQISIAILKLTWSCHRLRVGSELFGIPELFGQSFLVQLFLKVPFYRKAIFTCSYPLTLRKPHIWRVLTTNFFLWRRQYQSRRQLIWMAERTQKCQKSRLFSSFSTENRVSLMFQYFLQNPEFWFPRNMDCRESEKVVREIPFGNRVKSRSQFFKLTWSCHRLRFGSKPFGTSGLLASHFWINLF